MVSYDKEQLLCKLWFSVSYNINDPWQASALMFYKRRSDETERVDYEQQSCTEGLSFSHMFISI